jgi:arginyl-tRNA synthetase
MAAGADMHLSMLAQYAFEVAQSFSSYYAEVRILDGADDATIAARLALVAAVEQTLRNVMDILNIDVVKAM